MESCKLIAEISTVHLGSIDQAKILIRLAAKAGANYVKLQKRNPAECVPEHLQNKPHPNPEFAYGKTYLEHRKNLEFTIDQHCKLKIYCEQCGVKYASSVWDLTSAKEIVSLNPEYIKIPSACNTNFQMLHFLLDKYVGDIHISLGMILNNEKEQLFKIISHYKNRIVTYHCTSEYPTPVERLYLKEIDNLKSYGFRVGFSDHGLNIAMDVAAYILGANWIERHFIENKSIKHTDVFTSLEPFEFNKLSHDLKSVYRAMVYKNVQITPEEQKQREKLRY